MVIASPAKEAENRPLFETRDQNLIIILVALKHEVVKFEKRNGIVTVFFDKEETQKHVDGFYGNRALPLEDARMFNSNFYPIIYHLLLNKNDWVYFYL